MKNIDARALRLAADRVNQLAARALGPDADRAARMAYACGLIGRMPCACPMARAALRAACFEGLFGPVPPAAASVDPARRRPGGPPKRGLLAGGRSRR